MKNLFLKILFIISIILTFTSCTSNNSQVKTNEQWKRNNIKVNTIKKDEKENKDVIIKKNMKSNENIMTEKEFINSWSAKAIENETDLWSFFSNDDIGFSLNYPLNTELLSEDKYPTNTNKTYLKITINSIWNQESSTDFSKEEQKKNIEELSKWNFWVKNWFSLSDSQKVKSIWFLFAQDYITLSRFEICNVTLERELLFYFNNKEIKITSYAPIKKLKKLMPEYFTTNKNNCWNELIWNFEKQKDFYITLINKKASKEIQYWYDDFDKMSNTIIFDHK